MLFKNKSETLGVKRKYLCSISACFMKSAPDLWGYGIFFVFAKDTDSIFPTALSSPNPAKYNRKCY